MRPLVIGLLLATGAASPFPAAGAQEAAPAAAPPTAPSAPSAPSAAQEAAATPGLVESRYSIEVERDARELFGRILSPYCPGLTLTSCPSEGAFLLKEQIRRELAAGRTPDEVMAGLEVRFGPTIHARPPTQGFGLLAWILPFAAILVGAAGVTWWLRRSATAEAPEVPASTTATPGPAAPTSASAAPTLDPATRARLDAALRRVG